MNGLGSLVPAINESIGKIIINMVHTQEKPLRKTSLLDFYQYANCHPYFLQNLGKTAENCDFTVFFPPRNDIFRTLLARFL